MDLTQLQITEEQERALEYALLSNAIPVNDAEKTAFLQARLNDTLAGYVARMIAWSKSNAPKPTLEEVQAAHAADVATAIAAVEAEKVAAENRRIAAEAEAARWAALTPEQQAAELAAKQGTP